MHSLSDYCKETFGEKVYRLSLDGGMTCPNRDGTLSTGGCAFCSQNGSGDFAALPNGSVTKQLEEAKKRIAQKTACKKYIAYFQSFTNTYAPVSYLRGLFQEAIDPPDVVALSIGTRSDCLQPEVLDLLQELSLQKPVWVELGFQTMHDETHRRLNTMSNLATFHAAVHALRERNIPVVAHIILGLPGETTEMMLQSVKHIASLPIWGVKLQMLHVLEGTALGAIYQKEPFPVFTMEEYCELIIDCLELLSPDQVIHRITGDGPRKLLIAPGWSTDKKRILNTIHRRMKERKTYQGRLYQPQ